MLAVTPFGVLTRRLSSRAPARVSPDPSWPAAVRRAIERGARMLPGTTCLVQSLAGLSLLRRGGHAATLRIGVRSTEQPFTAHAWVECDGLLVAGDSERLGEYREICRIDDAAPAASS